MEEYYLDIRNVHIASAILSGSILLVRSVGFNFLGASWPMATWLRYLVYTLDTVLLTAAMMLMTITQQFPLETSWLTVKILLLMVYVILAWTALGRSGRSIRMAATGGAGAVFLFVFSIARSHNPAGFLA